MSIYEKLNKARELFHARELKKTGKNKFAGYSYFELSDFVVPGLECMAEAGLCPVISFPKDRAVMTIHDMADEKCIVIDSPLAEAQLKGCHPVQNLGASQTFLRRYLWMSALEIVEHDAVDASQGVSDEPISQKQAAQLRDELESVNGDETAFCKWAKVGKLEDIPARSFAAVLETVRRKAA